MLDMCNKNRNEQNPLDFCKHNGNYIYLNMFLPFAFFGPDTLSFGHCPNYPSPMHAIEAAFSRRENFIFCVVLNWVKMIIWIVKNGFYGSCPETGLFMVSLTVRVTPTPLLRSGFLDFLYVISRLSLNVFLESDFTQEKKSFSSNY